MEITVRQLIKKLDNIKEELKDKPVKLIAPNGLLLSPEIKFQTKREHMFERTKEAVECIVLSVD